jgi:hypothetical protein
VNCRSLEPATDDLETIFRNAGDFFKEFNRRKKFKQSRTNHPVATQLQADSGLKKREMALVLPKLKSNRL